jgi:esterase FrsA
MPFRWTLDPQHLFSERYAQMLASGLPAPDVDAVRAAITQMWPDEPGGWVYEWSQLAARYAGAGRHDLATLGYGFAKFPALADDAKRTAYRHQIEHYQLAAPDFPVSFQRRIVDVRYGGATISLPVHLLAAPGLSADAPVLLASGGVDTWKVDLHGLFARFALHSRARIVAFDIPGTGETPVPLSPASTAVIDGLIAEARRLGNGQVAHLGISMGGYFAAYSGLSGQVDAAVVLGAPVEHTFTDPDRRWEFGMEGIVGNAVGFDRPPTPSELAEKIAGLSLRPLLDQDHNSPMLIINGADDVHVPQRDTLVFAGRRDTQVELVADTGHCAVTRLDQLLPKMVSWLDRGLTPTSERTR